MIEGFVRGLLRLFLRGILAGLGGVRAYGLEHVPEAGPLILAPNHVSHLDPILIGVLVRRPVWFLATDELFTIPVLGTLSRYLRAFPIRQDSPDRKALRRAEELLRQGEALVVFPEGHESLDGKLKPLQGGAILLARRTGACIVPVGIRGSERVLPPREWRPRHGGEPIVVRFGKQVSAEQWTAGCGGREGMAHALECLRLELLRLSGQADNGEYSHEIGAQKADAEDA